MAEYVNIKTEDIDKNVPTKETFDNAKPQSTLITLNASNWDSTSKTQTVTVEGILANEDDQLIVPTPKSTSATSYVTAGVYASGQGTDSLTFTCETIPTVNLQVYIVIETVKKKIIPYLTFSSPYYLDSSNTII